MVRQLVVAIAAAYLTACATFGPDAEEEHYVSSDAIEVGDPSNPGGKKPSKDTTKPLVPILAGEEGGPSAAVITIDGQTCTVTSAGLETGLGGRGWTLRAQGTCPTGFSLAIRGVSDQPYPQNNPQPFLAEEGAILHLTSAAGDVADTFTASAGGNVTIAAGPTSADKAPVRGAATVAVGGAASHTIQFHLQRVD